MLQLTSSLPFLQWPVPSTFVFVVVNAAPVTGLFASATDPVASSNAAAATPTSAVRPAVGRRPSLLLISPSPVLRYVVKQAAHHINGSRKPRHAGPGSASGRPRPARASQIVLKPSPFSRSCRRRRLDFLATGPRAHRPFGLLRADPVQRDARQFGCMLQCGLVDRQRSSVRVDGRGDAERNR